MRRLFAILATISLLFGLSACSGTATPNSLDLSQASQQDSSSVLESSATEPSAPPISSTMQERVPDEESAGSGVLVAYFSATGNTEKIALHLQDILDADLCEIVPEDPYTSEDLDYSQDGCRANQEQNDPAARPAIAGSVEKMEDYSVVFLGYPIWWGQAPKILCTFLENYDFDGVTIVPFCTSGSSDIGSSATTLQDLAPNANWLSGQRFSGSASRETVAAWVEGLNLPESPTGAEDSQTQLQLRFAGGEAIIALEDNATTRDFLAMLPATLTFEDYAGSEKISFLDQGLSTENAPESYDPQAGDVALYTPWGNLAIFYGDAGSSSDLVFMGRVISGLELLAGMDGTFEGTVTVLA